MYLDNLSGDIFSYSQETQAWHPIGNVGLHDMRSEANIQGCVGIPPQKEETQFKTFKSAEYMPEPVKTSDSDIICDVKKHFQSHWIFNDVYHEFICENIQKWAPHTTNVTSFETVQFSYTPMAIGKSQVQIAEHNNCIALQFNFKNKHKETLKILQNFINNALQRISNEEKVGTFLVEA